MRTDAASQELICLIYRAASDPRRWPEALGRLKALLAAQAVVLARHDLETGIGERLVDVGLDAEHARRAEEHALINPWMRERHVYQPGQVVAGEDILGNAELMQLDFYERFLRPQRCLHRLCGVVARRGDEIWCVSLLRRPDQSAFDAADRQTLAALLPYLEPALELQWELARERSGRRVLLDLLDQLPVAVLLVDAELRLVMVNAGAEGILALNDGLAIRGKRLRALWHPQSEQLERLVVDACAVSAGQPAQAGGHLTITRPSGRRAFLVIVNPLPRTIVNATGQARGVAALVVKDPELDPATSVRGRQELAELYELTPVEERLVGLILDGLSLFEAADRLGVSKNTARTHMKHIYAKTGTRRQVELVRRLAHLTTNSH